MAKEKNKLEVVLSLMDKATAPLQAFSKRIEKLQEPVRKVSNKLAVFGQATGFGKLRDAAGGVASAFGDVASEAGALATKIVAGVGLAGGAIFGLAKMTADYGDEMSKAAQRTGTTIQEFQRLSYAAGLADVSNEDLSKSLIMLNRNAVEAATGSKTLQTWFKRAGLSVKDLKTMKPAELFAQVSDAISALPADSPRRAALAMALLGRSGANMLPMLKDGAAGLKELGDEAERYGLIIDQEAGSASEDFNDNITRMMSAITGAGRAIGVMLMPFITEVVTAIREWVLANRELIAAKVSEWIARLRENWPEIKQGALDAWDAIKRIADMASGFVDAVGGIGNTLLIVAAVMVGPLIAALVSAAGAVWALGAAILTTPVGWFMAAVAAIAGVAYLIYKNWEPITQWLSLLWNDPLQALNKAWDWYKETFSWSPLALIAKNWEPIRDWFKGLWDDITGLFDRGVKKVQDALSSMNPMNAASSAWDWGKSLFTGDDASNGGAQAGAPAASMFGMGPAAGVAPIVAAGAAQQRQQTMTNNAKVEVDFKNVPRGVEVTPGSNNTAPLDLSMGYAMVTPG